jgi:hypothetical protein
MASSVLASGAFSMEATHQYVYVFLSALGNLLPVVGILPERGYKDENELLVIHCVNSASIVIAFDSAAMSTV